MAVLKQRVVDGTCLILWAQPEPCYQVSVSNLAHQGKRQPGRKVDRVNRKKGQFLAGQSKVFLGWNVGR